MSSPVRPADDVVALDEEECLRRLTAARTGYLSTTDRALPVIVPVAVSMFEGQILLAPVFGGQLTAATTPPRDVIVALGVGELDHTAYRHDLPEAWSVVAQGVLCSPPFPSGACALRTELVTGWRRATVPVPAPD